MNWDNIRVFLAVARGGSISNAGRELGINHSTVLRRINALEEELNVRLFHREPRGYILTNIGERIMDSAIMMDQDATTLKRLILSAEEQPVGKLRVAMPPGTCLNLMPIISAFKARYPEIELTLDSQSSLHNLDKMEADIAIRLTMEPPEHYMSHMLFEMPFQLYASKGYLQSRVRIERLSDLKWICYEMPTLEMSMEDWLKNQDPESKVAATVNTLELVKQSVINGMGVSFLPIHIASRHDELAPVTQFDYCFSFPVYLLVHRDLYYQARIKKFFEFAKQHMTECR